MKASARSRILAIASKEWRLNTRFFFEYLANNLISPVKTAILMYFIYAGFLGRESFSLGMVNKDNFHTFVFIGTTCHGIMLASVYVFRTKMLMEKWWQTVTATLISPVTTIEMIFGFILGSGTVHVAMGGVMFAVIAWFSHVSISAFLASFLTLCLLATFAFGLGLLGATMALCWEGKSFLFDYGIQGLTFLSCFYYPIETLPKVLHPVIQVLPTYHAATLIQQLYLYGESSQLPFTLAYLSTVALAALLIPGFVFENSLKRYGIVGY